MAVFLSPTLSYRDQFVMLAESIAKEREEVAVREKAQNQVY